MLFLARVDITVASLLKRPWLNALQFVCKAKTNVTPIKTTTAIKVPQQPEKIKASDVKTADDVEKFFEQN